MKHWRVTVRPSGCAWIVVAKGRTSVLSHICFLQAAQRPDLHTHTNGSSAGCPPQHLSGTSCSIARRALTAAQQQHHHCQHHPHQRVAASSQACVGATSVCHRHYVRWGHAHNQRAEFVYVDCVGTGPVASARPQPGSAAASQPPATAPITSMGAYAFSCYVVMA